MDPKWASWTDPAKVCLISVPIMLATAGMFANPAWSAGCVSTIVVKDGAGNSQTFCRGADVSGNFENFHVIIDPTGNAFAAVNANSQLLVSTGAIAVSSVPNPTTVAGTVAVSTVPNPTTVTGTVAVSSVPNPTTVTVGSLTIGTMPNPTTVAGTISVNNASIAVTVPNPISASVQGFAADSTAAVGNPVLAGGQASTSEPTAAANNNVVNFLATTTKKLVDQPWATPQNYAYGTVSSSTTTAVTIIASPGASLRLYGWVECGRTDTGTSAVTITFNDTGASVFVLPNTGGGGGNNVMPPLPLQWGVNSAMTVAVSAATTTVYCSAQAFKSAV